jgi:SAM-dependent methyltransferase
VQVSTVLKLIDLNRQFYQTFAGQFSASRMRIQPGIKKIIGAIPIDSNILDLGCGNGELALALLNHGFYGNYVGLDFSAQLLKIACDRINPEQKPTAGSITFLHRELTFTGWGKHLPFNNFDFILAFAILHHLPSTDLRRQLLQEAGILLNKSNYPTSGCFIHSEWQFLNSPRLRARIQPWESIGLKQSDVEEGDYLLDWRQGGRGLRYIHHVNREELEILASTSGFQIKNSFLSDGEGGRLGIYQVWEGV